MTKAADITYRRDGLFTSFCSGSSAGDKLMAQMMSQNEGSAKVLSIHEAQTIAQIRARGYIVRRAAKVTAAECDALLAELLA